MDASGHHIQQALMPVYGQAARCLDQIRHGEALDVGNHLSFNEIQLSKQDRLHEILKFVHPPASFVLASSYVTGAHYEDSHFRLGDGKTSVMRRCGLTPCSVNELKV